MLIVTSEKTKPTSWARPIIPILIAATEAGPHWNFPWFSSIVTMMLSIVTMMLLIFATEAGPHWNSSFYGPIHSGASQHNTDNDKNGDCDNIYKKCLRWWFLLLDFSCGVASIAWRAAFQTNYEQWKNLPSSITSRQVRSRHKHIIPHLSTKRPGWW